MNRVGRVQIHEAQVRMADNDTQHIVEIMGDATRQASYGFHFLGVLKLQFEFGLFKLGLPAHQQRSDMGGDSLQEFDRFECEASFVPVVELHQAQNFVIVPNGNQH
jgi:hypothetical protein